MLSDTFREQTFTYYMDKYYTFGGGPCNNAGTDKTKQNNADYPEGVRRKQIRILKFKIKCVGS